ncbi:MAG: peptide chain release factor-like protein [Nitrospirota bacterium]|jgi:protein subunit release factor B
MGRFPVSAEKEEALLARLEALGIREEDVQEHFIRSGGHGGQHVNKTSTCVYLRHVPTGLEVKCQMERSQGLNRYRARVILADRLEAIQKGEASREAQRAARIRRQKRRRSRRAKEKVLEAKRQQAGKKRLRAPVESEE